MFVRVNCWFGLFSGRMKRKNFSSNLICFITFLKKITNCSTPISLVRTFKVIWTLPPRHFTDLLLGWSRVFVFSEILCVHVLLCAIPFNWNVHILLHLAWPSSETFHVRSSTHLLAETNLSWMPIALCTFLMGIIFYCYVGSISVSFKKFSILKNISSEKL